MSRRNHIACYKTFAKKRDFHPYSFEYKRVGNTASFFVGCPKGKFRITGMKKTYAGTYPVGKCSVPKVKIEHIIRVKKRRCPMSQGYRPRK